MASRRSAISDTQKHCIDGLGGDDHRVYMDSSATGADMAITLYGIKNCDTVKKARTWLAAHDLAYAFHDYKTAGIDHGRLERWCKACGWEILLNRAGTTYRALPDGDKHDLDQAKAIVLMMAHPSLIKRPVLEWRGPLLVGFKPESYARALKP